MVFMKSCKRIVPISAPFSEHQSPGNASASDTKHLSSLICCKIAKLQPRIIIDYCYISYIHHLYGQSKIWG